MPLSDGTRLGPYEILGLLGAGGMGEVYRATDTRLKRQVAIKVLPPALAADPDRLARFQREAEVLASLNHPRIAAIYGLEDTDATKALVMELVEGPTLFDRIAQGPLPFDEALPIARQIAEALEAAHERGIVHRDLKPANIKVRDDGAVKVLDFGLAKLAEMPGAGRSGVDDPGLSPTMTSPAMTAMGVILGTATYMSPEQARGRVVDKRTDIWAFGAVLYEMLTGRRAFEGDDLMEVIAAVVKTTPDWTAIPAGVPPHVVTLIQRCLDKDRNARIGDLAVARFLLSDHATSGISFSAAGHAAASHAGSHTAPHAASHAGAATGVGASGTHAAAVNAAGSGASAVGPAERRRPAMPWMLAAIVAAGGLLAGAAIGGLFSRRASEASPVTHLQMNVSPADQLVGSIASVRPAHTAIALSPDGRTVAFSATRGATTQLYVRALDRAEAAPLQGTEGAIGPFFSADGAWIGYWADNKLRKVPVAGGPSATICDVPTAGTGARRVYGASWAEDGTIFFASSTGILKVSSAGGTPEAVATPDASKGERFLHPQVVPGGKAILFTTATFAGWDTANIVLHSLDTGQRRVVISGGTDAHPLGSDIGSGAGSGTGGDTDGGTDGGDGRIAYMKSGTLMAVPFDFGTGAATGPPVALVDGVMQALIAPNSSDETGVGQFAVSRSGTLIYASGGIGSRLRSSWVWVARTGAAQPVTAVPPGSYLFPRLSPDGQKVAVTVAGSTPDLWLYDVTRGAPTRLTFDGATRPVWSPDGKRLAYASASGGVTSLYALDVSGGKPERLTTSEVTQSPAAWSANPNTILFLQRPRSGATGIWTLPMDGERKPRLFLESTFSLTHPEISPDGRWLAYVSNESGTLEVYVQSYPTPGQKVRISTSSGTEPIWSPNGREILYQGGTADVRQFFSASVRSLSPFQTDTPRLLFEAKPGEYDATFPLRSWNVSPDGQRFLMSRLVAPADKPVTVVQVVLNWAATLPRLVPAR